MAATKEKEQVNCPFPTTKRPYFGSDQIEQICTQALTSVELLPSTPEPIRIDRFLEKKFGISPEYEELPTGVLGFTRFTPQGVDSVVINRWLDDDPRSRTQRRVRSTLAHEAGHILLHGSLFEAAPVTQLSLLEPIAEKPKVLCRDDTELSSQKKSAYNGKWWEYQANMVIGSLLLPRSLVQESLKPYLIPAGLLKIDRLDQARRENAARTLAEVFDVNPVVARIRIDELYPPQMNSQLSI